MDRYNENDVIHGADNFLKSRICVVEKSIALSTFLDFCEDARDDEHHFTVFALLLEGRATEAKDYLRELLNDAHDRHCQAMHEIAFQNKAKANYYEQKYGE